MHFHRAIPIVIAIVMAPTGFHNASAFPTDKDDDASMASKKKVESLKSSNTAPLIANPRKEPSFGADFEWTEQRRVWQTIRELIASPAEAWGSLTTNLENSEYCITVESGSGSFSNWTVGDACRIIVSRTLSEAYFRTLHPMTREIHAEFRSPPFAHEPRMLKEWLLAHADKTLVRLQAEACEVAITQLSNRNDEHRDNWIATIRATVRHLRNGEAPILYPGFGAEELRPCNRTGSKNDPFADEKTDPGQ